MSRVVVYTPNEVAEERCARLYHQLRLLFVNTYEVALDFCPMNAPWTPKHVRYAPPTGAIVWNGYGGEFALDLMSFLKAEGIPFIRMEQGWFPQSEACYFAKGLGALSELSHEIESHRWDVDWAEHRAWLAQIPHYPKPGLPENYILVCGQVEGDSNLVSLTCPRDEIPALARRCTDYPVVYRPHPKQPEPCDVEGVINVSPDSDLMPQLSHARAVVAGTSTCLLEAASMSVPAVSMGLGVWTEAMIRHAIPQTLKHVLEHVTEDWDPSERQYGVAVLRQHAEIKYRRPRFRSTRIQGLLRGLV